MAPALDPGTPVTPVEFVGIPGVDDAGVNFQKVKVKVNGLWWVAYDLQDVRRVQRVGKKLKDARHHPTRRTRYYYNEADADAYRGLEGFVVHPRIRRDQVPEPSSWKDPRWDGKASPPKPLGRDTTTDDVPILGRGTATNGAPAAPATAATAKPTAPKRAPKTPKPPAA